MENKSLSSYEVKVLRELNGEPQSDISWGAAMGVAIEYLRDDGLVSGYTDIKITEAGRKYLENLDEEI